MIVSKEHGVRNSATTHPSTTVISCSRSPGRCRNVGLRKIQRLSTYSLVLAILYCIPARTQADHPPYVILQSPTASSAHHPSHGYSPGYGYAARTHSYAYGWFGAPSRQHWSRSFGVNRNYTQWSTK